MSQAKADRARSKSARLPRIDQSVGEMMARWLHGSQGSWQVDTPHWMCLTMMGIDASEEPAEEERAWHFFSPLDPKLGSGKITSMVDAMKAALAIKAPNHSSKPTEKTAVLLIMVKHGGGWSLRGLSPAVCPDGIEALAASLSLQGFSLAAPVVSKNSDYGAEHARGHLEQALVGWEAAELSKASAPGASSPSRPSL